MIPIIIFQVYYSTMNMSTCHFADQETSTRCTVIIITINTNTAPSPEVELRTLRQALCLFHQCKQLFGWLQDWNRSGSLGHLKSWSAHPTHFNHHDHSNHTNLPSQSVDYALLESSISGPSLMWYHRQPRSNTQVKEPKEPFQNHRCEKREASTLLRKTDNNLYLLLSFMQ
jgi:hypothetical protein